MLKTPPIVAVVGRPNVGKSTFFNTIAGHRISIVEDTPGVTRDRVYADTQWTGRTFTLVDTGGIDMQSDDVFLSQMRHQAQIAIDTADVILFFTDARDGLTHQDEEIAGYLRAAQKPVLLVVNKLDYAGLEDVIYEFYQLGMGDPIGISSTNMLGLGDLLDEIVKLLPEETSDPDEEKPQTVSVALVGRPNVGKSSLLNRMIGQERAMVSDIPGTTRDAIDTPFLHPDGTLYNLIDTAGIRRKRVVEDGTIERYSVIRSFAAIRRCDVVLLLIDANDGVTEQDTKIAGIARDEGKACIIVVNKWDAIEKETGTLEEFQKQVLSRLDFISYAPVLFISALTGQRTHTLWEEISKVYAQATKRIPTGALNDVIGDAQIALQAPMISGKRLRIYYAIQSGVLPPEFLLFVNEEHLLHFAYERYLENQLRKAFGFEGTPLRLTLRKKSEKEVYNS